MSRLHGVMDWCSPPKLKLLLLLLTTFLLASTNFVCLHGNPITGVDHNLHCVNDYLVTINCSLSITPSENSSYWLTFIETFELEKFACMLTNIHGDYFCSVKTFSLTSDGGLYLKTFGDLDNYEISLCHNQNNGPETCELLDEEYRPVTNIKPNAPCCLTVSHNSNQHHFTWKSTYEEYDPFIALMDNLKFQLHYYKRGDTDNVVSREINTESMNFSMDDQQFLPYTEYTARVRSSPNLAFYMGQWSDWSSEVHWKMGSVVNDTDFPLQTFDPGLGKVFIAFCVTVALVSVLLCYAPVKKWKQSAFIPTPAPYFHTLYSDCKGDFKSWVVTQENTPDMLKAEKTLRIDTLTKCMDIQEEECQLQFHHQLTKGSSYSNITNPECDASLLSISYTSSTMAPLSVPESSFKSLTLCSQPGCTAEGDSGCWLSSHTSLEREPPLYCNEYCTLSAFQQISPVIVEPVNKILPNRDDQSGCHH